MREARPDTMHDSGGAAKNIVVRLERAMRKDGDFPVRAKAVSELRRMVNDPNTPVEQIADTILTDPSLGTRILHVVNSVVYQRSVPIVTVSQAVMQLGMKALCDLCSGFVLMQKFGPTAQKGGVFADQVKRCILCSMASTLLMKRFGRGESAEQGYLAGTFFELGPLLLAFYFPQIVESAEDRASTRGITISRSLTEIIGESPVGISLAIIDKLSIPDVYKQFLADGSKFYTGDRHPEVREVYSPANLLATAAKLAELSIESESVEKLRAAIVELSERSLLSDAQLLETLAALPEAFAQHCKLIDMEFLQCPQLLLDLFNVAPPTAEIEPQPAAVVTQPAKQSFRFYLDDIRTALANRETLSSIITTAMEALAFGYSFDRVLLLVLDTADDSLVGRMSLGKAFGREPQDVRLELEFMDYETSAVLRSIIDSSVETLGEPLLTDGWPFVVIPIGDQNHPYGVIYADYLSKGPGYSQPLNDNIKISLSSLVELLQKAVLQGFA